MKLVQHITRRRTTAIGLDIGGRSIKAVQLARSGSTWRLHAAVSLPQPEVNQPLVPQTARYVREALFRHGFIGDRLVLAAPAKQLEVDVFELPPRSSGAPVEQIARAELARSARLESQPFEIECWDLPTPTRAGSSTSVMAVALRHSDATAMLDPFEAEGFNVVAIDTQAWALARAAGSAYQTPGAITALLDIGWNSALMCLVRDGVLIYQRVLSDAGLGIAQRAVQDEFKLADDEAEYVLANIGVAPGNQPPQAQRISQVFARYLEAMMVEIEGAFAYATHRYADTPVSSLLVAGGGSKIAGLREFFASKLSVEAKVLRPDLIVECPQNLAPRGEDGSMTIALGLAWHGIK